MQPQIVYDMTNEAYHAHPAASVSGLKHFVRSPAHYMAYRAQQIKDTPALRFGRILHRYVLEPDACALVLAPTLDRRTKDGKLAWELAQQDACESGAEMVKADEADTLAAMRDAVYTHPAARKLLFAEGEAEVSVFWADRESGEACKCRPDFLRADRIIVDLKSAEDASPDGFSRACAKYGYAMQAAMYSDGVKAALGQDVSGFVFVAVEKDPPYAVGVYVLDAESLDMGRRMYRKALMDMADCKIRRDWPAYSSKIESLSLPRWALKEGENA